MPALPTGPRTSTRVSWSKYAAPVAPPAGQVGIDRYAAAHADPRYQQIQTERMAPLRDNGFGYSANVTPAQAPPAGAGSGGAGGGKTKAAQSGETLFAHRLRGMPFLGRNMCMFSASFSALMGFTILVNPPYLSGITEQMTVGGSQKTVSLSSSSGVPMFLIHLFGGLALLAFEYFNWGKGAVRVDRIYFQIRAAAHLALAVPGYLGFFLDDMMPVVPLPRNL
jgi:hypothetical protein